MNYKQGDRVKIKSLDWYNRYTNGTEVDCGAYPFTSDMKEFCGQERIIANVCQECYFLLGIDDKYAFTDEMIEGLVEEEEVGLVDKLSSRWVNEFNLPDGYIFKDENGNVINATKIVLEKKKKEYPKTYEECAGRIMDIDTGFLLTSYDLDFWKGHLLTSLQKLLIARNAYWKLYGEEMGLGKPWEPDWENSEERRYSIVNIEGNINLPETTLTKWILKITNKILVFPTEEMRDAFYENFKVEIESCKELL